MIQTGRIHFEHPETEELKNEYTLFDMHFHTKHSDGMNSTDDVAQRARQMGIGVAITDHNAITGALKMQKHTDVPSIPGIELTAFEGTHVLAYFYSADDLENFFTAHIMPSMGSNVMSPLSLCMHEILDRLEEQKALVIFPHPYSALYTGICNPRFSENERKCFLGRADGVEVINGSNLKKWNLKSAVLGFNLEKGITGGSDGHHTRYMGQVLTCAKCEKDPKAFLMEVKKRQTQVVGEEISFLRKVTSNTAKIRKNYKNCKNIVQKNIRFGYDVLHNRTKNPENEKRASQAKVHPAGMGRG